MHITLHNVVFFLSFLPSFLPQNTEARFIAELITEFVSRRGVNPKQLGVISLFRAQADRCMSGLFPAKILTLLFNGGSMFVCGISVICFQAYYFYNYKLA
jgi:hypothetical protein